MLIICQRTLLQKAERNLLNILMLILLALTSDRVVIGQNQVCDIVFDSDTICFLLAETSIHKCKVNEVLGKMFICEIMKKFRIACFSRCVYHDGLLERLNFVVECHSRKNRKKVAKSLKFHYILAIYSYSIHVHNRLRHL